MGTIAENISRIQTAKDDIKAAIEGKGVNVGSGTIDTYAEKINLISTGDTATIKVDTEGLLALNWNLTSIDSLRDNLNWYEPVDGQHYIVSDTDKTYDYDGTYSGYTGVTIAKYDSDISVQTKAFSGCSKLVAIPKYAIPNDMSDFFNGCENLKYLPDFDWSNVTDMSRCFKGCRGLNEIPIFEELPSVTAMTDCYYNTNLYTSEKVLNITYPNLIKAKGQWLPTFKDSYICFISLPNCIDFEMFSCWDIIVNLSLPKVTSLAYALYPGQTEVDSIYAPLVTNWDYAFYGCYGVYEIRLGKPVSMVGCFEWYWGDIIPSIDLSDVVDMTNAFKGCAGLINVKTFGAVRVDFDMSDCTMLTEQSMVNIMTDAAEVTGKTMTFGSTNLAKLTDGQKAIATNKGWTLA